MSNQQSFEEYPVPSTSSPPSPPDLDLVSLRVNRLLPSSQIRAFLAASEDVDVETETIEELVAALISESVAAKSGRRVEATDFDFEVSELDISALYCMDEEDLQVWTRQQIQGMMHHLKEHWSYVLKRNLPIPQLLLAFGVKLSPSLHTVSPATMAYFLRVAMSRELVGVSCGIPDFRSRDGLYASLKERGEYDLDDPQQMFDINYFRENPAGKSCSQIYPSNFVPSPCHRFIKLVEDRNQNYTQNIDTLETLAGVSRVLQCHGSFATASCLFCRRQVPGSVIEADILAQKVPLCSVCNAPRSGISSPKKKGKKKSSKKAKGGWDSDDEDESDGPTYPPGIMKPNITFFGEKLTDNFDRSLAEDRSQVDLLLVIGTSLKVSPVADILCHLPHSVPQILINKTPVRHINPDIILLGNADDIIVHLCSKLGWDLPSAILPGSRSEPSTYLDEKTKKRSAADLHALEEPRRVGYSHVWLFDGAEGGEWLENIERTDIPRWVTLSDMWSWYALDLSQDPKQPDSERGPDSVKRQRTDLTMKSWS
ncbi:DHS-like NAD/FAD-binding domain-containing protein [Mycena rebaudengoi]|nr:DHS-like NAD/FAD-binding domain-containing protein [Mycena rebaudengoi]